MKAYRYLTGPDDAEFCERVTELLNRGWVILGTPTLAFDPVKKTMMCGQTLFKDVEGLTFEPGIDLNAL